MKCLLSICVHEKNFKNISLMFPLISDAGSSLSDLKEELDVKSRDAEVMRECLEELREKVNSK